MTLVQASFWQAFWGPGGGRYIIGEFTPVTEEDLVALPGRGSVIYAWPSGQG